MTTNWIIKSRRADEPEGPPSLSDGEIDRLNRVHGLYGWLTLVGVFFGFLLGFGLRAGGAR